LEKLVALNKERASLVMVVVRRQKRRFCEVGTLTGWTC